MSEAIHVLEQAWAVAYKEVGKEDSAVPTIDMITGMCVWGGGGGRGGKGANSIELHESFTKRCPMWARLAN
jgi:hypothetical protein